MFATFACFVAFSQQSGTTLSAFSTESDTLDDACASMRSQGGSDSSAQLAREPTVLSGDRDYNVPNLHVRHWRQRM